MDHTMLRLSSLAISQETPPSSSTPLQAHAVAPLSTQPTWNPTMEAVQGPTFPPTGPLAEREVPAFRRRGRGSHDAAANNKDDVLRPSRTHAIQKRSDKANDAMRRNREKTTQGGGERRGLVDELVDHMSLNTVEVSKLIQAALYQGFQMVAPPNPPWPNEEISVVALILNNRCATVKFGRPLRKRFVNMLIAMSNCVIKTGRNIHVRGAVNEVSYWNEVAERWWLLFDRRNPVPSAFARLRTGRAIDKLMQRFCEGRSKYLDSQSPKPILTGSTAFLQTQTTSGDANSGHALSSPLKKQTEPNREHGDVDMSLAQGNVASKLAARLQEAFDTHVKWQGLDRRANRGVAADAEALVDFYILWDRRNGKGVQGKAVNNAGDLFAGLTLS